MKDKEKIYGLIEDYLNGRLQGQELENLEKQIETDPDFAAEVRLHRRLAKKIGDTSLLDFKKKLEQVGQSYSDEANTRSLFIKYKLHLIAATFILLLGITFIIRFYTAPNVTADQLFVQYFEPYESLLSSRGEQQENLFEKAMYYYENGDYESALLNLQQVDSKTYPLATFYMGVSQMALGDFKDAEKYLIKIADEEQHLITETATWYLALTQIKLKNYGEAEKTLRLLTAAENSANYKEKATILLRQLKRLQE